MNRLVENARCCLAMKSAGPAGTSATGARLTFTPSAASAAPELAPLVAEIDAGSRPSACAERFGGAQGMRRTRPPSWSVAMISRGRPAAVAAPCSADVSALSCAGETMFDENRITPPTSPARMRARICLFACVPVIATTRRWPTSSARVGGARPRGGRRERAGERRGASGEAESEGSCGHAFNVAAPRSRAAAIR